MPRTKTFDVDRSLDAVVELFWRQGYAATSIADLEAHLGLGRQSIYSTYGSKHDLYVRAIDRYADQLEADFRTWLPAPDASIAELEALLVRYAAAPPRGAPVGCFLVKAAAERGRLDRAVAGRVRECWTALEAALLSTLRQARLAEDIRSDVDLPAYAAHLLVVLQGMMLVGPTERDRRRVHATAVQALVRLR